MALTPIGIYGAEAGYTTGLAAGNYLDPGAIGAGGSVGIETSIIEPQAGLRSFKVVSGGAITYIQGGTAAGTTCAMLVGYLYIPSALSLTTSIVGITTATGSTGDLAQIRFNPGGGSPVFECGINGGTFQTGPAVSFATWYRFALRYDVAATTYKVDWWINGVAKTQATLAAQTIGTVGKPRWGHSTAISGTTYYDQLVFFTCANTDADPGAYVVWGSQPVSDGTHSFTLGDFQDEASSNIATASITSYQKVDEIPIDTGSDYIKQVVSNAASYVEHVFDATKWTIAPLAVEHIVAFANTSTGADNQKAQLYDGTTASDTYASVTAGSVANQVATRGKCFASPPSGGSWTLAKLLALRSRKGFSTDVIDPPAFYADMIEVASAPFATVPVGSASATAASNAPTANLGVQGGNAAATAAASSASTSLAAPAGVAAATGAALAPAANVGPNVGSSAATGAANGISVTVSSNVAVAAASAIAAAYNPSVSVGAPAGTATATAQTFGQVHDEFHLLLGLITATGQAYDVTAISAATVLALAGAAQAAAAANDARASLAIQVVLASAIAAARDPAAAIAPRVGLASALASARDIAVAIAKAANVEVATAIATAYDIAPTTLVETNVNPGHGDAVAAANDAAVSIAVMVGVAQAVAQAWDPSSSIAAKADVATGTAAAYDLSAYLAVAAGLAAANADAWDPGSAIVAHAGVAEALAEARDVMANVIGRGLGEGPQVGVARVLHPTGSARVAVPQAPR